MIREVEQVVGYDAFRSGSLIFEFGVLAFAQSRIHSNVLLRKMLFVTSSEVEDRRNRGFEEAGIYDPCESRKKEAAQIADLITAAFVDVKLGQGVGLFEGQALDGYETEAVRLEERSKDEKEDWKRIQSMHLNACHSSLSFFDPLGMRFHLPAFVCCELRGDYEMGLDISLSGIDDWKRSKFSLLSPNQKEAVAEFLQFLAEDADSEYSRPEIEKDLCSFWRST
jgi:hypothetical protein